MYSDLEVKIVNTDDMTKVIYIRDLARSVKHVSFDHSGTSLALSTTGGEVLIYNMTSQATSLIKQIDGMIAKLDGESEACSKALWHPDNRALTAPNMLKEYQISATSDWKCRTVFKGHATAITCAAWSLNGALLATASTDKQIVIFNTRTQHILKRIEDNRNTLLAMQWHPTDNVLAATNSNGELFMWEDVLAPDSAELLKIALEPAPLHAQPLQEISANVSRAPSRPKLADGEENIDDLDDVWGQGDDDGFIEDDDGAGYAEAVNQNGKRSRDTDDIPFAKRHAQHIETYLQPHAAFQPGSTPWRGNRRYLCLNLVGFVWSINQDTHHTVTVEFYDRHAHRDFHFTDPYGYDKACLNDKGSVFSSLAKPGQPGMVFYRPHETWTTRHEWRVELPFGEDATSLSLSETCIVITTSAGYVRIFSLYGLPLRIYRQKSTPAVTCTSWRDYVLTVGNGGLNADNGPRLLYTIENVRRDEVYQSEDILPLPEAATLRSVFFSDEGDPCVFDSTGVLLILQHWRTAGQAKWIPLLDTNHLERLIGGGKDESYWPVAVANNKFHCIILKGGEKFPYFPRPLLSEFEFSIPITAPVSDAEEADTSAQKNLEEQYVRATVQHSLVVDLIDNTNANSAQKAQAVVLEREIDKTLLQLIGNDCREGEDRGMRALELAALLRDQSGKMLEAANKIAARFGRDILGDKITQLAERRLVGLVNDDDEL